MKRAPAGRCPLPSRVSGNGACPVSGNPPCISPFRCLPLALLALAACSTDRAPPPSAATTPAHGAAPFSRQDFAAFRSKGIEQAARDVVPYDYWLPYWLMEATGMVATLGGENKAVAALKALGLACERHGFGGKLLIVESDLPVGMP